MLEATHKRAPARARRKVPWWVIAGAALCLSCSPSRGPQVGGETHWLALCSHDNECGDDGLKCVCGACTRACSGDEGCSSGQCYDTQSPLLLERCESHSFFDDSKGVCLAQCKRDGDCEGGQACNSGACVPSEPAMNGERSAAVSWDTPVAVQPSQSAILGAPDSIVGTWTQPNCDPGQPETPFITGCVTLVIERDGDHIEGRFSYEQTNAPLTALAPATDGSVGYPPVSDPGDFTRFFEKLQAGVKYRVLNGSYASQRLSFDLNRADVWRDWCPLQKPYRWDVAGRSLYFCAPQDIAEQERLNLGRRVLCRTADYGPWCPSAGTQLPCPCVDGDPLCSATVCQCDSRSCDVIQALQRVEVEFADERSAELIFRAPFIGPEQNFEDRFALQRSAP